jgi:hypothetical protein
VNTVLNDIISATEKSYNTNFDAPDMCISTTYISSVKLRSKKLEIRRNDMTIKIIKTRGDCREMGSNSSKDGAMHERANPLL